MQIPEPDWKRFRTLHEIALARFQERTLAEIAQAATDATRTPKERYHAVYTLLKDRNRELAYAFDDIRRSTALRQLTIMLMLDVISDDDLVVFSPETRAFVTRGATALREA